MVAVILVEPFDPTNVAASARAMASFGAGPLILVNPLFDTALLDPAIARGGTQLLDTHETAPTLASLRDRFDLLIASSGKPSNGTHVRTYVTPLELRERSLENTAIAFGRESDGLRVAELELCDLVVSIETLEPQRALNLSHAVAVVLAFATRIDDPVQNRHPISRREDREALIATITRMYRNAAEDAGSFTEERLLTQERVWKRLLARESLSEQEAKTIFGFMRLIDTEEDHP